MGERSNIFVRIRAKERSSDKNYKHETFFGLYYQWCYGERMISRLRSAINFVENNIGGWRGEWAVSEERISKFKRYLAINFDMQDIVEPVDLIPEAIESVKQGYDNAKADIFNQAENHGFIYLDITLDTPKKSLGRIRRTSSMPLWITSITPRNTPCRPFVVSRTLPTTT